jgi:hypothetical protein
MGLEAVLEEAAGDLGEKAPSPGGFAAALSHGERADPVRTGGQKVLRIA